MKLLYSIKQGEQYTKTSNNGPSEKQRTSVQRTDQLPPIDRTTNLRESDSRAGATSPVGQVSTGPLFSPSALTADLGDYDVRESIDEVREVLS